MRALNALAGLALAVALAGCSGDDGDGKGSPDAPMSKTATETAPSASPSPSDEQALEANYRTYIKAFLTGDGATAYGLLSERCKGIHKLSDFAEVSEQAAELYGLVDYEVNSVTINGDKGKVDAEYPVAALNQGGGSEWVREGDGWRSDKCD